eukprot:3014445-Pleurochrysis_carterae.AAC.1
MQEIECYQLVNYISAVRLKSNLRFQLRSSALCSEYAHSVHESAVPDVDDTLLPTCQQFTHV